MIIIQVWGYDVSGLIAGLGIGGLAISLAAQETLSNIFGFATIVSDRPLVVGEYIKTPNVEGIVERVGLRSTRVRQLDQAVVTVPNSLMASSTILNWSRLAKRQINLTLGVTYATTPDQMESLLDALRTMLKQRDTVDPDSVVVYFIEFGGSSLNILIRCYVNLADWGAFTAEKEKVLLEVMRVVEQRQLADRLPQPLDLHREPERQRLESRVDRSPTSRNSPRAIRRPTERELNRCTSTFSDTASLIPATPIPPISSAS